MHTFASETNVPINKSRSEIDKLLKDWGAEGIQWTDDFTSFHVQIRFVWPRGGVRYQARHILRLPDDKKLEEEAIDNRSGRVSQSRLDVLKRNRGRQEHRILFLWIKGALNAVEAGIMTAEQVFFSWIEDRDGRTVWEVAGPNLPHVPQTSAFHLLPEASSKAR